LENIYKTIEAENADTIVIGYPLNLKSEKTLQTLEVDNFINNLQSFFLAKKADVKIELFDERFTSKLASDFITNSARSKTKRQDKSLIDSISAQIILQDYLDKNRNKKP